MARTSSSCVIGRPSPRRDPSTSRKYRIFSPSFMAAHLVLQIEIFILQFEIHVKKCMFKAFSHLREVSYEQAENSLCMLTAHGLACLEPCFEPGARIEVVAQRVADEIETED